MATGTLKCRFSSCGIAGTQYTIQQSGETINYTRVLLPLWIAPPGRGVLENCWTVFLHTDKKKVHMTCVQENMILVTFLVN